MWRVLAAFEVVGAVAWVLLRRLLDLDRRVVDADRDEVVLSFVQRFVRVVRDQVHAQRWQTGAQRPDVQVVHSVDGWQSTKALLDFFWVDTFRRAFHQHVNAALDDANSRAQHQDREHKGSDWIGHLPLWVVPDQSTSNAHANALDEVTQRVDVRSFDVEVLKGLLLLLAILRALLAVAALLQQIRLLVRLTVAVAMTVAVAVAVLLFVIRVAMTVAVAVAIGFLLIVVMRAAVRVAVAQDLHQHKVDTKANARNDEHELAVHAFLWVRANAFQEALDRGVHEHAREHPDDQHAGDGTNHFRALEAKGQARRRWQRADPDGKQRDAEAADVRQQVRRVRHDGQTAGHEAAHDLGQHEQQRARARPLELALRALGGVIERHAPRLLAAQRRARRRLRLRAVERQRLANVLAMLVVRLGLAHACCLIVLFRPWHVR
ncbi:TPA: hypothetical protein N0F65_008455 [Lagenidium giganteum]|uniref:Uncharacterized protein n=1 Tax=Lagenidium giganteum TaxID=4803 RepID=A0AAV2YQ39_9STRA|nr:TPA: hypothetical protein N0F65_008455 [Lagenidium giganteum]